MVFRGLTKIALMALGLSVLGSGVAQVVQAGESACQGFIPENDEYYPVPHPGQMSLMSSGLTDVNFNSVLDRFENHYKPLLKDQGISLDLRRLWSDGTVNATAQQLSRNTYTISMYGGLARHPTMTEDGFLLVACHELGHHLGGAPTYNGGKSWASTEGQSDYFASMKCFKELFSEDEHLEWYNRHHVDSYADMRCKDVFTDLGERAACVRASHAGMDLAGFFRALSRSNSNLSFERPSASAVRRTSPNHPAAQCRLDTYFQGALCPLYSDQSFESPNPFSGSCTRHTGFVLGARPLCWFNPEDFSKFITEPPRPQRWWWQS